MSINDITKCSCANSKCCNELSFKQGEKYYQLKTHIYIGYCQHCRQSISKDEDFGFCSLNCLIEFIQQEKKSEVNG